MFKDNYNKLLDKNRFKNIIKYIKTKNPDSDLIRILNIPKKTKTFSFCNDDILEELCYILLNNIEDDSYYCTPLIEMSEKLYNKMIIDEDNAESVNNYLNLIKVITKNYDTTERFPPVSSIDIQSDIILNSYYTIYSCFNNKNLAFQFIDYFTKNFRKEALIEFSNNYVKIARNYYSDEIMFYNTLIKLVDEMIKSNNNNNNIPVFNMQKYNKIIIEQLNYDKKQAGIYDIDEEKIKKLENSLNIYTKKVNELINKVNNSEKSFINDENLYLKRKNELNSLYETIKKDLSLCNEQVKEIVLLQNDFVNTMQNYQIDSKKENNYIKQPISIEETKNNNKSSMSKVFELNPNFNVITSDSNWFCNETVNLLGAEYIANLNNFSDQVDIKNIYDSNLLYELKEILDINKNFKFLYDPKHWFTKEKLKIMDKNIIAFSNKNNQYDFAILEIPKLKIYNELLKINKNFWYELFLYTNDFFNKENVDILGLTYLANCDKEKQEMIHFFHSNSNIKKLKRFIDINPNFTLNGLNDFSDYRIKYLTKRIIQMPEYNQAYYLLGENGVYIKKLFNILDLEKYDNGQLPLEWNLDSIFNKFYKLPMNFKMILLKEKNPTYGHLLTMIEAAEIDKSLSQTEINISNNNEDDTLINYSACFDEQESLKDIFTNANCLEKLDKILKIKPNFCIDSYIDSDVYKILANCTIEEIIYIFELYEHRYDKLRHLIYKDETALLKFINLSFENKKKFLQMQELNSNALNELSYLNKKTTFKNKILKLIK